MEWPNCHREQGALSEPPFQLVLTGDAIPNNMVTCVRVRRLGEAQDEDQIERSGGSTCSLFLIE